MKNRINGSDYKQMLFNAAALVENNKQALNDLNVFPVPDGDTGTNMTMTLNHAVKDMAEFQPDHIAKIAEKIGMSLTRGSHGNSGVIVSLLFKGMAEQLRRAEEDAVEPALFAAAMKSGVDMAYRMVGKPAEGTILTVARRSAECAAAHSGTHYEAMLDAVIACAYAALAETPEQNPVLAKAGVVDAGGKGYCHILEGMLAAVRGVVVTRDTPIEAVDKAPSAFHAYRTEDIAFAYCTELIVERDMQREDTEPLRDFLSGLGDSLVMLADSEIIKIHVHTNHPGRVLEKGLEYGALSSIKIENMREQHTAQLQLNAEAEPAIAAAVKPYGFVAVAAGAGIRNVFTDLGVDHVVEGGQTMNPSTDDILRMINRTPAETVFVLPNNSNIKMAAEQAAELTPKQVIVIPTKTVPEGVTAMLGFDPERSPEENRDAMCAGFGNVRTGDITYAARDSVFDGVQINEGDFLALANGKLCSTGQTLAAVAEKLTESLQVAEAEFVTIFSGADAAEEDRARLMDILKRQTDERVELNMIDGGQPVYYFIIGVE